MRYLILYLVFFTSQKLCAQEVELSGRFTAGFLGAESIDFVGKDSFYFSGFYCTHGVKGKGTCLIRDNKLFLYFEKAKQEVIHDKVNKVTVTPLTPAPSAGKIEVHVFDTENKPIENMSVVLQKPSTDKYYRITDSSGAVAFTAGILAFPLTITTSAVGYKVSTVKIDSLYNYSIKVIHQSVLFPEDRLINGQVYIYEIDDLSEDLVLMRPIRSTEPFRRYRKVSPDSTSLSNH